MKPISWICLFMAFVLVGCNPAEVIVATQQEPPTLSPTVVLPTAALVSINSPTTTLTPTISIPTAIVTPTFRIPTATWTPSVTLTSSPLDDRVLALLAKLNDCAAPCVWGITPGQTTSDEAVNIFRQLVGPSFDTITMDGQVHANFNHKLANGLSFSLSLLELNNVVKNILIRIGPEQKKESVLQGWAYSPEALIRRYGKPSRVEFSLTFLNSGSFTMVMYFDQQDLIVEYMGSDINSRQTEKWDVCPITTQIEAISLWMGKNPIYSPQDGVSLEKAASMSIDEFSKLMTGEPDQACFSLEVSQFKK
jgi:hypothetical protein